MTIGTSLVLITVGAILRFAVSDAIPGVELGTVGLILLIVGLVGLVIGLVLANQGRSRAAVVDDRPAAYPRDPDPRF